MRPAINTIHRVIIAGWVLLVIDLAADVAAVVMMATGHGHSGGLALIALNGLVIVAMLITLVVGTRKWRWLDRQQRSMINILSDDLRACQERELFDGNRQPLDALVEADDRTS